MFDLQLNEEGIKPVPATEDDLEAMAALGPATTRSTAKC